MNDAEQALKLAGETLGALKTYFERLNDLACEMDSMGSAGLLLDRLITDALMAKGALREVVDIAIEEGE